MRWSAVFAGAVFTIGLWILLQSLGMGLGLSAVDVNDAGSLKGVGIGTGIWSIIAPLISLFIGGLLAGRLCGSNERKVGAMHGGVMWALASAVGLWALITVISTLASGVARVGGAAASTAGTVVSGAASAGGKIDVNNVMGSLGINADDLLGPINQRLQSEGKPPVTAEQLNETLRGVAQRSLQEGRFDRRLLAQELMRNTSLSARDVQDIANQLGDKYDQVAGKVGGGVEKVKEGAKSAALQAADKTGKVLLGGGIMMLLGLGASLGGAALGVRRRYATEETIVRTPPTEPPGRTPPTEPLIQTPPSEL
ncbi:MAG: YrzE family protein [Kofleriaceae bacterium]|nr:YrzE family protein [Kofleriaceae bacterium]